MMRWEGARREDHWLLKVNKERWASGRGWHAGEDKGRKDSRLLPPILGGTCSRPITCRRLQARKKAPTNSGRADLSPIRAMRDPLRCRPISRSDRPSLLSRRCDDSQSRGGAGIGGLASLLAFVCAPDALSLAFVPLPSSCAYQGHSQTVNRIVSLALRIAIHGVSMPTFGTTIIATTVYLLAHALPD